MLQVTVHYSFEAVLEKTNVCNMWKTVPCSRSSMTEAELSEPVTVAVLSVSDVCLCVL